MSCSSIHCYGHRYRLYFADADSNSNQMKQILDTVAFEVWCFSEGEDPA